MSPYTMKNKMFLDNVQRRATNEMNYKETLIKLGILLLEYTREMYNYRTSPFDSDNLFVKLVKLDYLKNPCQSSIFYGTNYQVF